MIGRNYNLRQGKILAAICVIGCLWGIYRVGSYGAAGFLMSQAGQQRSFDLANFAVSLFAGSADLYEARGSLLLDAGRAQSAAEDFERSVKLRPSDYLAWLELGIAREKVKDFEGAAAAYQGSAHLAPFYGLPRWYAGQLYYYTGQQEKGWQEMRAAYRNDAKLLLTGLQFAWLETRGNVRAIEEKLEIASPPHKFIFGIFLLQRGSTLDAAAYLCNSEELAHNVRQNLVAKLFDLGEYRLAAAVETNQCQSETGGKNILAVVRNKDFESDILSKNNNFDWQLGAGEKNVEITRDRSRQAGGTFSLKINFNGDVKTNSDIIKQLVLVEPQARYRLSLAAQSGELVTDSLPQIVITDAAKGGKVLATLDAFGGELNVWKTRQVEFNSPENTEAVWIAVKRTGCRYAKCPIFGAIWLDDINLERK